MKYINLRISPNSNHVEVTRACSHGDCAQQLKGDENYCPKCGSPLKKLPDYLDKDAIIALGNENIDKLPIPPTVESKANLDDHCSTKGGTENHDCETEPPVAVWHTSEGTVEIPRPVPRCLHGDRKPETCGLCTPKGACKATVLLSAPPQYNMCPFRGSGYIYCGDAV